MDSEIKQKILGLFLLIIGIPLFIHALYIFIATPTAIAQIHGIEIILGIVLAAFGWRKLKRKD